MTTIDHGALLDTQHMIPDIDLDAFKTSRSTAKARARKDQIMRVLFTATFTVATIRSSHCCGPRWPTARNASTSGSSPTT